MSKDESPPSRQGQEFTEESITNRIYEGLLIQNYVQLKKQVDDLDHRIAKLDDLFTVLLFAVIGLVLVWALHELLR